MNSYKYKAIDSEGRIVKGNCMVDTEGQLINTVNSKGLFLINYKRAKAEAWTKIMYKVTYKDLALVCKQLAQVLKCGINLSEGLKILYNEKINLRLRNALYSINIDIEKGKGISKSFSRFPNVFPKLMIQLINIGEKSGNLEQVFGELSGYYEKHYKINKKICSMLMYPIIVLVTTIMLTAFIIMKIVPEFIRTLADFGQDIPDSMKKLLFLSQIFNESYFRVFLAITLIGIYIAILKGYPQKLFHEVKYKIPIVKNVFFEINEVQLARNLKLLMNSGITIVDSLEAIRDNESNRYVKSIMYKIIYDIKSGENLASALHNAKIFKKIFISMVAIGEETGSLDEMLSTIAEMYENNIDETINRLTKLIEPVVTIILSLIIIMIIFNLVLPLFNTMYSIDSI